MVLPIRTADTHLMRCSSVNPRAAVDACRTGTYISAALELPPGIALLAATVLWPKYPVIGPKTAQIHPLLTGFLARFGWKSFRSKQLRASPWRPRVTDSWNSTSGKASPLRKRRPTRQEDVTHDFTMRSTDGGRTRRKNKRRSRFPEAAFLIHASPSRV